MKISILVASFLLNCVVLNSTGIAQWEPTPPELKFDSTDLPKTSSWTTARSSEWADSVFSPDRNWLLYREGGASRGMKLHLYQRGKDFHYTLVKDFDVGDQAEALALKQPEIPKDTALDHRYISFLMWSSDSKAFMFIMSGHDSGKNLYFPQGWFGIYDLTKRTISFDVSKYPFDLPKINQMTFTRSKKRD